MHRVVQELGRGSHRAPLAQISLQQRKILTEKRFGAEDLARPGCSGRKLKFVVKMKSGQEDIAQLTGIEGVGGDYSVIHIANQEDISS